MLSHPQQWTWQCWVNRIYYHKGLFQVKYSVIPWGQYSDKEVPLGHQAELRRVPVSDLLMPTEPECKAQCSARPPHAQGNRNHQGGTDQNFRGSVVLRLLFGGLHWHFKVSKFASLPLGTAQGWVAQPSPWLIYWAATFLLEVLFI